MNGRNVWGRGRKGATLFVLAGLLGSALLGGCLGDVHMLGVLDEDGEFINGLFAALILGPTEGVFLLPGDLVLPCEVDGETVACVQPGYNAYTCNSWEGFYYALTGSVQEGCFHGSLMLCLYFNPISYDPMKSLCCG